jgi:two-component system sensor histidine kinase PhoQ
MRSLRTRLLTAASIVLAAFVVLCGLSLERAFRDSAVQAQEERLRGFIYALLGSAEPQRNRELMIATTDLPDPRFVRPQSGLEAAVLDEDGKPVWSSPSADSELPQIAPAEVGAWRFQTLKDPERFLLLFGLRWVDVSEVPQRYTVMVMEDATLFHAQIAAYRRTLWAWLVGISAALLIAQFLVLRWGLSPLRKLVAELRRVETGKQTSVQGSYADELTPLTRALNAMIAAERNQQARYRNALGDLAHSLKTPLAVLRGLENEQAPSAENRRNLQEQVGRMQHIVDYQLRRAAAAGSRTLSEPVLLQPLASKVIGALGKVYAAKQLRFELAIAQGLRVRADEGDLYELLGNLLDNACKWGKSQVRAEASATKSQFRLGIEDDGPGFPDDADKLLERGARADSRLPGQGIGLAAVAELVKAYNGEIELGASSLGGAKVAVVLPL